MQRAALYNPLMDALRAKPIRWLAAGRVECVSRASLSSIRGCIIPICIGCGRNETYGPLSKRGDGQAGIDAQVRCHYRSVADVHILVTENPVACVHYAVCGRI